jgi:TRAP transporter TAXI family solute receptor
MRGDGRRSRQLRRLSSGRPVMRLACLLALLSPAFAAQACGGGEEAALAPADVRIATGLPGGVYRPYGRALAQVISEHLRPLHGVAVTTQGSVDNLQRLDRGQADVAFSLADTAGRAIEGRAPFSRPVRIAALARVYDDYVQVIARRGSSLLSIADLAGKTVSIGAPRSGTALTARRILELPRLRLRGARAPHVRMLGLEDSADALAAGDIDAFFWSGGLPTAAVGALRRRVAITLLELPAGIAADLDPNLYTETQIPRSYYGGTRAIRTVAAANLLVVRRDMPRETAFRLTRALFEHRRELERAHPEARRLNARKAIATYPLRLHPGAARWYRQARP